MPQGYYTIEQWISSKRGKPAQWTPIQHLPFGASLTDAENVLAGLGRPGFYRMVQMQRVIWAEQEGAGFRLRKSHASSPESLDGMRQMFDRCSGVFPLAEVQANRRKAKPAQTVKGRERGGPTKARGSGSDAGGGEK